MRTPTPTTRTETPLYVSAAEIRAIVRFVADTHASNSEPDIHSYCTEQRKALTGQTEVLDTAIFGRVLAGRPELTRAQAQKSSAMVKAIAALFDQT